MTLAGKNLLQQLLSLRQLLVSTSSGVSYMLRMANHIHGLCNKNSALNKLEHVPVEGDQYILNE